MRLPALALALTLAGCSTGSSGVPTDNVRDYRISFTAADANASCPAEVTDWVDGFTEYAEVYRIHSPEGDESLRVDLYARSEEQGDDEFRFFAAGTLDGPWEQSSLIVYAGGTWRDHRDGGTVDFDIEGRTATPFEGELRNGRETYDVRAATVEGYDGCTFTLSYEGRLLDEESAES